MCLKKQIVFDLLLEFLSSSFTLIIQWVSLISVVKSIFEVSPEYFIAFVIKLIMLFLSKFWSRLINFDYQNV
jgi:hypothetical protein